jgi:hypothetical protein
MTSDSQHELGDELLSAYLDDELSADERALVERRLAVDADARQMLEHLRSASQAVRELPHQAPDRDLRVPVLQKIEARPDSPSHAAAAKSEPMPKLTIGRTARGWVWASLAVAAALLIMLNQSDDRVPPIGDVAQRTSEPPAAKETLARDAPELRAWNEPAAPPAAPAVAEVDSPAPSAGELADMPAPSAAVPADESSIAPQAASQVQLGAAPQSDSAGEFHEGLDYVAASQSASSSDESELVVVHVLAKRQALENKSFEKLLESKGIALEAETTEEQIAPEPGTAPPPAESGIEQERLIEARSLSTAGCEAVLVEAPPMAIYKCMAELNQDSNNYPGVSVDDFELADDVSALEASGAKKLATDLGKYSRGVVPQQYKDAFSRDMASYYQSGANGPDARGAPPFGAELRSPQKESQESSTRRSEVALGRARKVQPRIVSARDAEARSNRYEGLAGAAAPADALADRDVLPQAPSSASAESENWQVLFLLCPVEEAAPSPAAANRAE